jgi:predicted ABC-type ATPase
VASGGYDIPESKIRERYDRSRENLISLIPGLAELRIYDNSAEFDESTSEIPPPLLVVHCRGNEIVERCSMEDVPKWAKPIVAAVFRLVDQGG